MAILMATCLVSDGLVPIGENGWNGDLIRTTDRTEWLFHRKEWWILFGQESFALPLFFPDVPAIPYMNSSRFRHRVLSAILRENLTVRREELKVGMKCRVWMRHSLLCSAGRYSYWGDIDVELKDQKLSSYSPDESPAEEVGYSAEVIAADGWTLTTQIARYEKRCWEIWAGRRVGMSRQGGVRALALPAASMRGSLLQDAEAKAASDVGKPSDGGIPSSSVQHTRAKVIGKG
ncbi:hypothetical protein C8J57DRAFT_1594184 [Mycena rebaudengoi]|nr:hypothetical protein C8J57DRAFT_1594184 [Mycena rebaudengoi]